jgi:hypothetical protein
MACYKEDFIVKNEFSRPGIKLIGKPRGIVMHWTATPGATDQNEHDFLMVKMVAVVGTHRHISLLIVILLPSLFHWMKLLITQMNMLAKWTT